MTHPAHRKDPRRLPRPARRRLAASLLLLFAAPALALGTPAIATALDGAPASAGVEPPEATATQHGRDHARAHRPERHGRSARREGRFREGRLRERRPAAGFRGLFLASRRVGAALDLTDEQRTRLREVRRAIGDERRETRREIADARRALGEAAREGGQSAEAVRTLGETLGRLQADAALQRREGAARVRALLTEEQRQKLDELRENRGRFRMEHRRR